MIVWMGYTPSEINLQVYKGKDNAFMKTGLQPGTPHYFKVAFYDTFGTTGLNISSSVSTIPLATGGILKVTELPENPEAVNGETGVWLDVDESTGQRGLWGWDGEEWAFTRDGSYLVANSVTAEKINAQNLASISANLGTITGGNFTLAADGFIKGGATSYSSGTGFWMGYHDSAYKWRIGTPGSSGAEWNGSAFNIYGPDGSVTISSGVVDWEKIAGENKPEGGATVGADSSNLRAGPGVNMVFNGDYTDGLAGTTVGWRSAGNQHTLSRNLSYYIVQGEGTAYIQQPGWNGTAVFDANIWNGQEGQHFAVTPGQRYEVYAYLNTHRCVGRVLVLFLDAAGNQITHAPGSEVSHEGSINTISDMRLSHGFVVAPWNAAKAFVIVRGYNIDSYDPYVFFSRVYFGMAHAGQTEASPWSPGRGISQITPSNVTTYIDNAAIGAAQIGSINLVGTSNFAVKSGTSGARMDMDSRRIKVFDTSGVLRVQLGDLTA